MICPVGFHVCAPSLCSKRTFTGPDGLPYRWDMLSDVVVVSTECVKIFEIRLLTFSLSVVQLSRDDRSKKEIARYHRGSLGIIGRRRDPRLDVDPDMTHMLDLIVLTFVYVEKIRMDKRQDARQRGRRSGQ